MAKLPACIFWYRSREDYETLQRLVPDARQLALSFDEWQKSAEQNVSELEAGGNVVMKTIIDPKQFTIWCRNSGMECNWATFEAFASGAAARQQAEGGA